MGVFTITSPGNGNLPPAVVGDYSIFLANRVNKVLTAQMFTTLTTPVYSDPEGDNPTHIKILTLPGTSGVLMFDSVAVTVGQEIALTDIDAGLLLYVAPNQDPQAVNWFEFTIRAANSVLYSEDTGIFTITSARKVPDTNLAPVVNDASADLSVETYDFKLIDFTTDFQDFNGDSYQLVKIETLPPIGTILYNSIPINAPFQFDLANITGLKFEMPGNTVISNDGYCEFDQDVDATITQYEDRGYTLESKDGGILKFVQEIDETLPNDTDIYAFFDTTSMNPEDADAASAALQDWYNQYKNNNELFVGNLYVIPIFYERWLDLHDVVKNGTGYGKINNPGEAGNINLCRYAAHTLTNGYNWNEVMGIYPPNFNSTTDEPVNTAWASPSKIVVLAFIDETNVAYHSNRVTDGLTAPTALYLEDYKRLNDNLADTFTFFKGIYYPVPHVFKINGSAHEGNGYDNLYNACVMQGFAAIEGGSTYTIAEMEMFGLELVEERMFHWYLDPNHPDYKGTDPYVANPYSPDAHTPVPGTNYELAGAKHLGWTGVYDKSSPASNVFSLGTFADDLNKYLMPEGDTYTSVELVEGTCYSYSEFCFLFRTSDDSIDNLFSNQASFCFTINQDVIVGGQPSVSDNSGYLRLVEYAFGLNSFIKDFADPDGDSYKTVTIKSLPRLGELTYVNQVITANTQFIVNNSGLLKYKLYDRYAVYNGVVYDFTDPISEIVENHKIIGYELVSNIDGKLTFKSSTSTIVIQGIVVSGNISFDFTTSDNSSSEVESNVATFTLIPEGNINIVATTGNQPPTVGNNTVNTQYDNILTLTRNMFVDDTDPRFSDPEGDQPYKLKVLSLPTNGVLLLRGGVVQIGQILDFLNDIDRNEFKFDPDDNLQYFYEVDFKFTISDTGSQKFA